MTKTLSDKIQGRNDAIPYIDAEDVREFIKKLKDFQNEQRAEFNRLFESDRRLHAHLHTAVNMMESKIDELAGEKLI